MPLIRQSQSSDVFPFTDIAERISRRWQHGNANGRKSILTEYVTLYGNRH